MNGESMNAKKFAESFMQAEHWVFLVFTHDREMALKGMLKELSEESFTRIEARVIQFPAGVLWNGEECRAVIVEKQCLPVDALTRGLRKHLGYECPSVTSDVFTLGVKPGDDESLDQVGLFGQKRGRPN